MAVWRRRAGRRRRLGGRAQNAESQNALHRASSDLRRPARPATAADTSPR